MSSTPPFPSDAEERLPAHHQPLPELDVLEPAAHPDAESFVRVQASPEFVALRSTFRRFAFPMTGAFLAWYFAYVLLSTYAGAWMSTPVLGALNIGLLMGLAQFVTTFVLTWAYVRHAGRRLDPAAAALRAELEGVA